jgi:hypothetical protein
MKKNKVGTPGWHCVEFQRKRREELSELYNTDKEKYFEFLKKVAKEFGFPEEKTKGK